MRTLDRCREIVRATGPAALDYMSRDIREALEQCRAFADAGISYDERRASEYADELAHVAMVRREITGHLVCACCGLVSIV